MGNHELAQWTGQWIAKEDTDLNESFQTGIATAYGAKASDVFAAYLRLFAVLPAMIRTANRVLLSHSLPIAARMAQFEMLRLKTEEWQPEDLARGGALYSLVWGRDTLPATVAAFLQKTDADWLITGHIPCDDGFAAPNDRQIILDAKGSPAAYCLFPADQPIDHERLVSCIHLVS